MTYRKINIKKFFSKFTQNMLIAQLFKMHNLKKIPNILDVDSQGKISKENIEQWQAFYLSLEGDVRSELYESIEKINYISNFEALNISETFKSDKVENLNKGETSESIEKVLTQNEILAQSYSDKALAFYIDYFEKVDEVVHLFSFYKLSGYKRYQAKGDVIIQDSKINKLENIEIVDKNLSERFENIIESRLGSFVKVDSKTLECDNMYFTKIKYKDGKDVEIYFVYIKDIGEVIVKASGSKQIVFEYAESYIKKLTGYAMDAKEQEYDMDIFVDKDYKDLFSKDKKDNNKRNIKYPLYSESLIYDWYIKSIKISRKINAISFNFAKSDEVKNMLPLYSTLMESGIDIKSYNIESMSLVATIKTSQSKDNNSISKTVKKNISINIKENGTSLNILKKEHREIDKILKENNVMAGYKAIDLQNKK